MPSFVVAYTPGSGYTPAFSGNPWSGQIEPVGGIQFRADKNNSGAVYISLSGAFVFSGQMGLLVGSGGPTITSGSMFLSGGMNSGACDGFPIYAGDAYFTPKLAFKVSGVYNICLACDPACSGQARVYAEVF